ncbi:MAG: serine/threonine-protein kinase [Nannocystaceae bacterium]
MERPTQFGPYLLLERISLGGMAEVFKAKEFGVDGFERVVAVKRILPHVAEDEEFIGMFKDEARIAVQLNHSNIAQIYSLGQEDDSFYIALEYVAGKDARTIYEVVRAAGEVLSAAQACFVVMKICEGLDYAHNKKDKFGNPLNLIHRDVSPPNVMVSYEGEVKLIDFGVVKAAGRRSSTKSGVLKGKFGYMAPEQVRGKSVDRRGDIFALGACLWEMLTSSRLFHGESDFETLEMVREGKVRSPREFNPDIPARLAEIVLKALAAEPDDRYGSAMEFHDDLQAFMFAEGLFYSRKNLAAWMRQQFRTDIDLEKEKAKKQAIATRREQRARNSTMIMGAGVPPPPPPSSGRRSVIHNPPALGATHAGRRNRADTQQMSPPTPSGLHENALHDVSTESSTAEHVASAPASYDPPAKANVGSEFDWDDDELETRLFVAGEGDELAAANRANDMASVRRPGEVPVSSPASRPSPLATPTLARQENGSNGPFAAAIASSSHDGSVPAPMPGPLYPSPEGDAEFKTRSNVGWVVGLLAAVAAVVVGLVFVGGSGSSDRSTQAGASGVPGPNEGALKLDLAQPDAIVKIDGVAALGTGSPRMLDNLVPGQHRISVVKSGYLLYEGTVRVKAGVIGTIPVKLERAQVTLQFQPKPAETALSLVVDGKPQGVIGRGPSTHLLTREPGALYAILAEAPGHTALTVPIAFDGTNGQTVAIELVPLAGAVASVGQQLAKSRPPGLSRPAASANNPPRRVKKKRPVRPNAGAAKPSPAKTATLKIGTEPGLPPAAVFVDGAKASSRTPFKLSVRPGSHRIEWRWPDGKTHTRTVLVDDGHSKLVKGRQ